jgi:hypothetical protein
MNTKRKETPSFIGYQDQPTRGQRDLARRRSLPFLDSVGVDRPISLVLEEVYLQGIKDAVEAMKARVPE